MNDIWFSSDHHFNHINILSFINYDGQRVRPEFSSVEEMNEQMIERHNSVVRPQDKWYCLGDIGFDRNALEQILPRLNGKKRLILGNHDQYKMSFYERFFQKILVSWRPTRSIIFTHFPIRIGVDDPKLKACVHGHIHRSEIDDPRYLNLSVEMINYTPINFNDIVTKYHERGIDVSKPS